LDSPKKTSAFPDPIRMQERLAVLLAFVAGYMDATGIIKWKTYVSFMSGNTTQLGTAISNQTSGIIITSATVIGSFVVGIYAGTCLSLWKRCKIKTLPFYIVSGILLIYMILSYKIQIPIIPSVTVMGFAMGIMNTIVTSVGNQKVNTDFVTGTLNSLARNTAMYSMTDNTAKRKDYKTNMIHLFLLWIGFVFGAVTGAFFLPVLENWTMIFPVMLLLIAVLVMELFTFKI
jgi:uncharacterized membrane protein YoaK (UPF0700 family)